MATIESSGGEADQAKANMAFREKEWSERGVDEKIEALRRVLLDLAYQFRMDEKRVQALMKHSHLEGKIMVPISNDSRVDLPYWAQILK